MSAYFEDNKAQEGHGKQSLRGGVVSVAARGVNVVVQVGSTICLARLLSPNDFGLVAMAFAVTGFASVLVDLGTRDAAVQKSQINKEEVSALFWLTLAVGCGFGLLVAACSPLIAGFYHEPRLEKIALVSSLTFVFAGVSCQHSALLRRAMMFQKLARIEIGANLFSAFTSIAMAFHGSGYWALVARPILAALFLAVGVWWSCRWWPGIPSLTTGVKEMLKFGIHITGFTMTDYVGRSADRVGLGYGYGPNALGFYQQAQVVYENTLGLLIVPLHGVAVAGLSKLRDNLDQLRKSWATALSTVAFFAMPAFGILAVTGKDLLVVLLGDKWLDAAALLSILALRGPAHVVERTLGWLHVAAGRADRWMRWGLISSLVQLAALVCGLPFGPMGVAIAYAVSMYILFVPAIAYAGRPLGIGASMVIRVVGPQLSGAWCSAVLAFAFQHFLLGQASRTERILLSSLLYAVSYCLIVVWAWRMRKPLEVARSVVRDFRPRRLSRLTNSG